jgi:Pregnancy-associated plasma protein-A
LILFLFFSTLSLYGQDCGFNLDIKKLKHDDPVAYNAFMKQEKITEIYRNKMLGNSSINARLIDENGVIIIPVVFHILHRGEAIGNGTNVSDARIQDQMQVLNDFFNQQNDQTTIPQVFRNVAGNARIQFQLACLDPNNSSTSGILRKQGTAVNYTDVNFEASFNNLGGDDAWPTNRYLNVWITPNLNSGVGTAEFFGYSPGPTAAVGAIARDGVVIKFNTVGRNATNDPLRTQGSTLPHEVGHWLDLFHPFGGCGNVDFCADTPPTLSGTLETVTCPITFPLASDCGTTAAPNGIMFDNIMDGGNDNCGRRMFTNDQIFRMRAVFQVGGLRRSFIDNYFKLAKGYQSCTEGIYQVITPFCQVNGNVSWSVTGPATSAPAFFSNTLRAVYPNTNANGTAILTASWNNFASDISIPVGYGAESSSYTPNYPSSGYVPLTVNQVHPTKYNRFTYGQVSFAGATGQAQNWRFLTNSSSSTTISGGNGNSFWIRFTQAGAFATIRADIPTLCGTRTVDYSFTSNLGGSLQFALSPNPASNNITITALNVSADPNARTTSEMPEYEVQIFTRYNQLMKKTKCPKGSKDITIDVSNLPSNQLYTVQFISSEDVQTKSFFKE